VAISLVPNDAEVTMFIFSVPSYIGVLLAMLLFGVAPVVLYPVIHRLWGRGLGDESGSMADTVSTRIGVIHAVVIGMMFANVTAEYTSMVGAVEAEASALIRLYSEMERRDEEHFEPAMKTLIGYINFVVQEQWPALREGSATQANLMGRELLDDVWESVQQFDGSGRTELARLLDEAENARNLRLFDAVGTFLPLFWYAAIIGYVITITTLCVKPPDGLRRTLLFLYGCMVGVVLYGILVMTQPYSLGAGVDPSVFQRLLEAML
jgi:hypothetical protein